MGNIAIIPARGGSKGLKNKNIKDLCGRPMINYTIKAALESDKFDVVLVSTDSLEIAEISEKAGAEVPFIRPKELAQDNSKSVDVIHHALEFYSNQGIEFENLMVLQPTSPLRTSQNIIDSFEMKTNMNAISIISVVEAEHSPMYCNTLDSSLSFDEFIDVKYMSSRRQEMEKYYRLNGAIYLTETNYFGKTSRLYGEKSYAFVMEKINSVDIDDIYDFIYAESLIRYMGACNE